MPSGRNFSTRKWLTNISIRILECHRVQISTSNLVVLILVLKLVPGIFSGTNFSTSNLVVLILVLKLVPGIFPGTNFSTTKFSGTNFSTRKKLTNS